MIHIHTYFNIMQRTSAHVLQTHYTDSYLATRIMMILMLISILHNSIYTRSTWRLCVCSPSYFVFFSFFVKPTTTRIIKIMNLNNTDRINHISNGMSLTRTLYATFTDKLRLLCEYDNDSEYIVKFQYCWLTYIQNFMKAYDEHKNDTLLTSDAYYHHRGPPLCYA